MRIKILLIISILLFLDKYSSGSYSKSDSILYRKIVLAVSSFETGNFENSYKTLNELKQEIKETDNVEIVALFKLNYGTFFYKLNDKEAALNGFLEAMEYAELNKVDQVLNSIYNNIGIIYSQNFKYDDAKTYFLKALKLSQKLKDERKEAINFTNLSNLALEHHLTDTARFYAQKALELFEKVSDYKHIAAIKSVFGSVYEFEDRYLLAKNAFLEAYQIEQKLGDPYYASNYLNRLAYNYLTLGLTDSAIFYAHLGIEASKKTNYKENLIDFYKLLGKLNLQSGLADSSVYYYKLALSLKDTLLNEKSQKWVSEMQMRYDFTKKQKEIELLAQQNKMNRVIQFLLLSVMALAIFFIWYYFRSKHIKVRQAQALLLQEAELRELELRKTEAENKCLNEEIRANEEINRIKQEQLRFEIEHKNRELSSNALHLINKNSILSEIQQRLVKVVSVKPDIANADIKEINHLINSNISLDNDWESFKIHFEEIHGNFFGFLKENFPDLTTNDLRMCAYLNINLSPKEISQILNISPESVRKRKQRLREKLNLEKEEDLTVFFNSIKP